MRDMLPEHALLRAIRLGIDVHPLIGFPHTGEATQRAQVGQRIRRGFAR